jgi:cell division protein FtsW
LSIQPSEIAKLSVPLLMGRLVIQYRSTLSNRLLLKAVVLLPLVLVIPLVFAEPDLGTSIYLVFLGSMLLWIAGWPVWNSVVGLVIAVPGLFVFFSMKAYQWERIRGFLLGWEDADHASYQIRQSLISLSEGGIHGVGLGKGWQKLSYLPEANTDFVFSVIGEELGLLGTLCLIGIWLGFFLSGYKILSRRDRWSYQYIVGLTLLCEIVLQAALNTAVVTALVPPKGISHPFLSYGGSNLCISLVCVGIILSLGSSSSDDRKIQPFDNATS